MTPPVVTRADVSAALRRLGLAPGGTAVVHASLSAMGFVVGGAETIVRGVLDVLGPEGTLAAPAQSWRNLDPERGVHDVPEVLWPAIRAHWPPFDPDVTPSIGMGAVAEAVRTWPGARRSDHPARSWAAVGARAEAVTARHDLEDVHGDASPLGGLEHLGATILLLGVGYDKCTALHLAETRAAPPGAPRTEEVSAVLRGGRRARVAYRTLAFDDADFPRIGAAFEAARPVPAAPLGAAAARAVPLGELVAFAAERMRAGRGGSLNPAAPGRGPGR